MSEALTRLAETGGDDTGDEQNDHQRVREKAEKLSDSDAPPGARGLIRPVLEEATTRLNGGESPG